MLQPQNRKYRKDQKGKVKLSRIAKKRKLFIFKEKARKTSKDSNIQKGTYGLKSIMNNTTSIKASQIEATRRVIIRHIRRIGKIYYRIFPYKPVTKKPIKTRMGKGKGNVQHWVCPVKPGQIIVEISGQISPAKAKEILEATTKKLPILTRFFQN